MTDTDNEGEKEQPKEGNLLSDDFQKQYEKTRQDLHRRLEELKTVDLTEMLVAQSGREISSPSLLSSSRRRVNTVVTSCFTCFGFITPEPTPKFACSVCEQIVGETYYRCLDCDEAFYLCEQCEALPETQESHANGLHVFAKIRPKGWKLF